VSARENVDAAFARADEVGAGSSGLNIFLSSDRESALSDADTAPASGLLAATPVVVKDNIATTTLHTSCGSRILEGYVSPYEATAVRRLRSAGGVVIAKSNMDEFAMGSSTEHSAFGPTKNPLDPSRAPGGSSGGSAAAVAAGIVKVAYGSETGGSVRQPAAFCGVVGVKPTYGRVSRFGLVAFASSLDQIGVFGASVYDAARGLQAIAGFDENDSTSVDVPVGDYVGAATERLDGLVVGVPKEYFPDTLDPEVRARCDATLDALRAAGATVREVSLPHTEYAIPVYYIIAPAECSSNLARFDGVRYGLRIEGDGLNSMYMATRSKGFGTEVTRRILLGTYVLSHGYYDAYYRKAQEVRALITRDFETVWADGVHLLLTPTTPTPAFQLGAITDPYEMYLSDIYTVTANLAGIPAISVPAGLVGGMPVGAHLMAPRFEEETMFRAAFAIERAGLAGESR